MDRALVHGCYAMMGRAGRPQYDSYGEGFIITTKSSVLFYLTLLNEQLPIESQLISRLCDSLNSEVAIGSVDSIQEGVRWLGYTYLCVRMIRNPSLYGVNEGEVKVDRTLKRRRAELIHAAALLLDRHGLVSYDQSSRQLTGTHLGRIASNYYIGYKTMSVYQEHMKPTIGNIDLLRIFALSKEFEHMYVRQEEKLELSRLAERVPIPIRGSLEEAPAKVSVLLQAYVSRLRLEGLALAADMIYVTQSAGRLARALFEIALHRKWAPLREKCLNLCKMITWRQWPSQTPLRQFSKANGGKLTEDVIRKIERKDVEFERYFDLTPGEIGELVRDVKTGKTVYRLIHYLPHVEMRPKVQPLTRSSLHLNVSITPDFRFDRRIHGAGELFHLSIEDADGNVLLHEETFYLSASLSTITHTLDLTVPITKPRPPQYFLHLSSDRWICPDSVLPISLRHLELPDKFAPHTEPLESQPLPTASALKDCMVKKKASTDPDGKDTPEHRGELDLEAKREVEEGATRYFSSLFDEFNPIQTQVFHTFYHSDNSAVLCSGTGSGRFVCGELALFRAFALRPTSSAVFLVPSASSYTVPQMTARLAKGIGRILNLTVAESHGIVMEDLVTLNTPGAILVTSDRDFNTFSRRWKQKRKTLAVIANIAVIVVYGIHALGESPLLEMCISRIHNISKQLPGDPIRLILIGDPIANASNVASWIRAKTSARFSFRDDMSFVNIHAVPPPLSVEAMARNIARLRRNYARKRKNGSSPKILVFASGIRKAHLLAMEITTTLGLHSGSQKSLGISVGSRYLRKCLEWNVGYVTEQLGKSDLKAVTDLWNSGSESDGKKLEVFVTTYEWAREYGYLLERVPDLVVIAGTEMGTGGSEGEAVRRVEYSMGEVRFMTSFARMDAGNEKRDIVYLIVEKALEGKWIKELRDPLPVESGLLEHGFLIDAVNSEIASKIIESKQDNVDWFTWTFFYRRLLLNPGFYGMSMGKGLAKGDRGKNAVASEFLSEIIESTIEDLVKAKCIAVEGDADKDLAPLDLGMIASHYQVQTSTIELFASLITEKTRVVGLLDVLSSASEYSDIEILRSDPTDLENLAKKSPVTVTGGDQRGGASVYADPHVKAHLLFQSHFSRTALSKHLERTRAQIVKRSLSIVEAIVDVCVTGGYLKPALEAMELSKMIVQGMWDKDGAVLQLPHVSRQLAKVLEEEYKVESVYDLLEMEDEDRNKALKDIPQEQLAEIARVANGFPSLKEIAVEIEEESVRAGDRVVVRVKIEREIDDEEEEEQGGGNGQNVVPQVLCPRFGERKEEGWWIVVGDLKSNTLMGVRRLKLKQSANVKMQFECPEEIGMHKLQVILVSDSYMECDQEETVEINVVENREDQRQEE
eukprot:Plantae.Rhodophyta-Hildenbrandia_rubra.ctg19755.p1 GENE.Plantae.Rhodophyta-Hildenbrandia_rubra.ctg19755~~Plantae.Rhodophyta-Hildenbrandia_rubra.ctg19755.p1  ORF type:complete len:1383 (+),score=291.93 Plantae.Rhodophyta-Hildenbrandia_rubra.ctg19755:620-4768(+)